MVKAVYHSESMKKVLFFLHFTKQETGFKKFYLFSNQTASMQQNWNYNHGLNFTCALNYDTVEEKFKLLVTSSILTKDDPKGKSWNWIFWVPWFPSVFQRALWNASSSLIILIIHYFSHCHRAATDWWYLFILKVIKVISLELLKFISEERMVKDVGDVHESVS